MYYPRVRRGVFVERPNRFVAHVELDGQPVVCHVKNTGRCRELLTPGAVIYLQESDNPNRKTRYDLIAVEKGGLLINMDAQAPNQVFRELSTGRRGFVEVKGVTLEENGYARFPDAPTERGVKHLEELIACRAEGYETAVCFVLQMSGMREFAPNDDTHPAFGAALRRAAAADVQILARECMVTPDSLTIAGAVPVRL